jgi:formylmethanofuran dehydrogenase subunit E
MKGLYRYYAIVGGNSMNILLKELETLMKRNGTEERIREYLRQCIAFHSFAAPGLLIGVFMVDLALEKLGAASNDKVYAVAETSKCAPDAVQVITHATIGNRRLRIIESGRFSITLNRPSSGKEAKGVRVYVDAAKIKDYPILNQWYTNDSAFEHVTDRDVIYDDILRGGRRILSWEPVSVMVPRKEQWKSVTCSVCSEIVPDYLLKNGVCATCLTKKYYE